jgi:hypothetical protein
MTVTLYLRQGRNHDFPEVPLVLGIKGDDSSFMCPHYRLTSPDYAVVCLGG